MTDTEDEDEDEDEDMVTELREHQLAQSRIAGVFGLSPEQLTQADFLTKNPRAYNLSECRTGKTAATAVAARWRQVELGERAYLIICPLTVVRSVWRAELEGLFSGVRVECLDGTKKQRLEALAREADFYVINFECVKTLRHELIAAVDAGRIDGVIIDELTHYAEARSGLSDAAQQVINGHRWNGDKKGQRRRAAPGRAVPVVWGLTGTPGDALKIYGQVRMVTPYNLRQSFTAWRDSTCVKRGMWDWVQTSDANRLIAVVMQPAIRFNKSECITLPPVDIVDTETELSAEQKRLIKKLRTEALAELDSGRLITAPTAAALASKLLQISAGIVITETEETEETERQITETDAAERYNEIIRLVQENERQTVIFCAFTGVVDKTVRALREAGIECGYVDGRVSGRKRGELFERFAKDPSLRVLVCHPRTTAFGVELASASQMIFNGPPLSGGFVWQQALERLSSRKQTAERVVIRKLSSCHEERRLFVALEQGQRLDRAVTEMFRQMRGILC